MFLVPSILARTLLVPYQCTVSMYPHILYLRLQRLHNISNHKSPIQSTNYQYPFRKSETNETMSRIRTSTRQ